ncbi:MAG: hypothetical protein PHX78_02125 [bacterium]|nr:hypothetical protein [bacterium]
MIDKAIVGYIDILGYGELVEKLKDNIESIQGIEDILINETSEFKNKYLAVMLKNVPVSDVTELKNYWEKVFNIINVRFISDSILFTLPLNKIDFSYSNFSKENVISDCIYLYFMLIGNFCMEFIEQTGYVIRGGISIGAHYEKEINSLTTSLFVFSEAYLEAVKLEKKAENPRILIGYKLLLYFKTLGNDYLNKSFFKDIDGNSCFDFYSILNYINLPQNKLSEIQKNVTYNLNKHIDKLKELSKLIYFAKYHNRKVSKDELNFEDLAIDLKKFEKIL